MSCKCSKWDMDEGYKCSITGDRCAFMIPNSKRCAEEFGEGPDVNKEKSCNSYKIGDYVQLLIEENNEYKEYKGEVVYIDNSVITLDNDELGEAEIKIRDIIF